MPDDMVARHTVLVVDDEELVRTFIERVLIGVGYRVLTATSGGEAVSLLHAGGNPISLVITDLRMPGMSGLDLAEKLAQLSSHPPVLYVSGGEAPPQAELARFLQKPFTKDQLCRAVRIILGE